MAKGFLVFAGYDYYPVGGAKDLIGWFKTIQEAEACPKIGTFSYDGGWANILSLDSLEIVVKYSRGKFEYPAKNHISGEM